MSTYESVGTVRYEAGEGNIEIVFAPDDDHFIKHKDIKYAIFLTEDGDQVIHKRLCKSKNGVPISVPEVVHTKDQAYNLRASGIPMLIGTLCAATNQTKILVRVKKDLTLTGVYVPHK